MKCGRLIIAINKTTILLVLFILLGIIPCIIFGFPLQETGDEYDNKTSLIFLFSQYLTWPQETPSDNFIIAVIGRSKISIPLNKAAQIKKLNNRDIVIKQFQSVGDIEFSHILFIPKSAKDLLPQILEKVKNSNTLLISEIEGFAQKGAAINFVPSADKLVFEINRAVLDQLGIKASSQLLRSAILVKKSEINR